MYLSQANENMYQWKLTTYIKTKQNKTSCDNFSFQTGLLAMTLNNVSSQFNYIPHTTSIHFPFRWPATIVTIQSNLGYNSISQVYKSS